MQYRTGEGPCLETLANKQDSHITDTSAEPRWRAFCVEALAHGVRSCLSLPLLGPDGLVGGYNLYNPHPGAFDDDVQARMRLFAGTAAGAVALGLRLADQSELNEDLHATLASRSVIDQAVGIVMAQQRCSVADAFALLGRASQNRNLKVHTLAAEIVTTVGARPPGPPPSSPTGELAPPGPEPGTRPAATTAPRGPRGGPVRGTDRREPRRVAGAHGTVTR
ncbi:GAF and ANTAR domain-containing protein [Streptosporangium sp. NPDC048865]|uniref:GAF and ANTAR domain-containing protein n=1 Tax=Streptosporangium sp. NPDC048865 TaxID=3155766 RepID=UPI003413DEEC